MTSEMPAVGFLALIVAAAIATSALVIFAIRPTLARHVIDVPNDRSLHSQPTPRGGGLAIVVASCLLLLAAAWLEYIPLLVAAAVIGCGLLVAAVSLCDDFGSVPQLVRLVVHAIAAAVLVAILGGYSAATIPFLGTIPLGIFGWLLPWLWLIACTNAFNFMDGIDGLAGGFAVVAGLAWLAVGYLGGVTAPGVAGLIIAGSSLGFLPHNWSPARIFLGDVGSAFLGFALAALPLLGNAEPSLGFAAVLILWPFLFDTGFTLVRRLLNQEPLMDAHRSHLYQRLVLLGWRHATVSLLYMCIGAISAAASLWWLAGLPACELVGTSALLLCAGSLVTLVSVVERQRSHSSGSPQ